MPKTIDKPTQESRFDVSGMSCASFRVERILSKQPGVSEASVNFAGDEAQVVYDPDQVGTERMAEAVRKIGYEVSPIMPDEIDRHRPVAERYAEVARVQRRNVIGAARFTVRVAVLAMALGLLSAMIAAGAMAFSSLSVVANSLRLRRFGR